MNALGFIVFIIAGAFADDRGYVRAGRKKKFGVDKVSVLGHFQGAKIFLRRNLILAKFSSEILKVIQPATSNSLTLPSREIINFNFSSALM
uniref:Uncharacterized protein n=1 Tax=Romanomermis culicivorax TaxID=13658 RepID=A0A915JTP4_ROMCU